MSQARFLVGDVFDRLADLSDGSVDLVLTSPPFLALRSYLPADHPDKAKEIGSEPTPAAFLDTLLHLTAEWRRVLAPHGSIAVELGDTYAGSGGAGGDYGKGGWREGQEHFEGSSSKHRRVHDPAVGPPIRTASVKTVDAHGAGWPLDKSLCGIPHLYHLSLAYGRNLLTGEPSPAGQWRVRNVVAWCRPNPPVGALGDKFRPATSYMTIATPYRQRYFDLDAVRTVNNPDRIGSPAMSNRAAREAGPEEKFTAANGRGDGEQHPGGAPPLDWWEIATEPYQGTHYATWPSSLCVRPIKAMCPQRVCRECGKPSARIVDARRIAEKDDSTRTKQGGPLARSLDRLPEVGWEYERTTLGWTDCGHDNWRNGIVLDPFAGSGTTLAVAVGHGRDAIGIDLDERNAELARERVGMFLEVEYDRPLPTDTPDVGDWTEGAA